MADGLVQQMLIDIGAEHFVVQLDLTDLLILEIDHVDSGHELSPHPRTPDHDIGAVRSGDRAFYDDQIIIRVHFDNLEVAHGNLRVTQLAAHLSAGKYARREARGADRTGSAMEQRAVRRGTAAEMMPPDDARESAAFAHADHVRFLVRLELVYQNPIARLQIPMARTEAKFLQIAHAVHGRLLQVSRLRLINPLRFDSLDQAELDRVVAVDGGRLALHHHARSRFQDRDRDHLAVWPEDLGHANFFTENSWAHSSQEAGSQKSGVRSQNADRLSDF